MDPHFIGLRTSFSADSLLICVYHLVRVGGRHDIMHDLGHVSLRWACTIGILHKIPERQVKIYPIYLIYLIYLICRTCP